MDPDDLSDMIGVNSGGPFSEADLLIQRGQLTGRVHVGTSRQATFVFRQMLRILENAGYTLVKRDDAG